MLDGMLSSFASSPSSNAASDWCTGDSVRYTSVLPHHTITRRSQPSVALEPSACPRPAGRRGHACCLPLLHVRSVESFHVTTIEHGGHRRDRFELGTNLLEQRSFENAGSLRALVSVVAEKIPRAEHHIVERRQRHEFLDERRACFGTLAEANGAHLGQGSDRTREPSPDGQNAGNGRGAYRTHANQQDAELSRGRLNLRGIFHNGELYHQYFAPL